MRVIKSKSGSQQLHLRGSQPFLLVRNVLGRIPASASGYIESVDHSAKE